MHVLVVYTDLYALCMLSITSIFTHTYTPSLYFLLYAHLYTINYTLLYTNIHCLYTFSLLLDVPMTATDSAKQAGAGYPSAYTPYTSPNGTNTSLVNLY